MALDHDFFLIPANELPGVLPIPNPHELKHRYPFVPLHDDLITYFWDTLQWVPAWNPFRNEAIQGLDRWGVTIWRDDAAASAASLLHAWALLLKNGPDELVLTIGHHVDEETERTIWDRFHARRDELVSALERLATFCEQASTGQQVVLHCGI